ncbi:uncharacterized protein A4U43_C07F29700 [Asparagus officinalis]|uniref:Uncharacterized protein n=1 Tax=Asparagus officinalis TaxID=4686 RepID=A0A5P1EHX0_ASPOF|nr:uncharacterized protein A4U43_C07F29700 [Asparagus officinalis]
MTWANFQDKSDDERVLSLLAIATKSSERKPIISEDTLTITMTLPCHIKELDTITCSKVEHLVIFYAPPLKKGQKGNLLYRSSFTNAWKDLIDLKEDDKADMSHVRILRVGPRSLLDGSDRSSVLCSLLGKRSACLGHSPLLVL